MIDWEEKVNSDDVNSSVLAWQSLFLQIMELSIPCTTIKVKSKTP